MEYATLLVLHVFFGVLWAGGAIAVGLFVVPSVIEAGPGGGAVMAGVLKRRFPIFMVMAGFVVVLTGLRLYTLLLRPGWLASPQGVVLGLGGLAGIVALAVGFFVQKPAADRLGALGAQVAAAGAPPTAEQAAEMQALRARLARAARVTAWHLIAASLLMASHRLAAML